jgi:hypothetical protein
MKEEEVLAAYLPSTSIESIFLRNIFDPMYIHRTVLGRGKRKDGGMDGEGKEKRVELNRAPLRERHDG